MIRLEKEEEKVKEEEDDLENRSILYSLELNPLFK